MTESYQSIRHYLDQRQLCLAEVKIKAAIANLGQYLTYTQRGEGQPDEFRLSVTDDIQQAVTGLSEILERLEPENEYQKQAAIARMAAVARTRIRRLAFDHSINVLPKEIACAKNAPLQADEIRQAQAVRYQQAGLSPSEAEKLLGPPMPQTERDSWQAKAAQLQAELDRISAFVMDVPRFDPKLLVGTRLEHMAHE